MAFDLGASAIGFWSFTDLGGGASSWREYLAPQTMFAPLLLDGTSVVPGEHLAALREGVEDFAYLTMFRDAVAAASAKHPADPVVGRAQAFLATEIAHVLEPVRARAVTCSAPFRSRVLRRHARTPSAFACRYRIRRRLIPVIST